MATRSDSYRRSIQRANRNATRTQQLKNRVLKAIALSEKRKSNWILRRQASVQRYREAFAGSWLTKIGLGLRWLAAMISPAGGRSSGVFSNRQSKLKRSLTAEPMEPRLLLSHFRGGSITHAVNAGGIVTAEIFSVWRSSSVGSANTNLFTGPGRTGTNLGSFTQNAGPSTVNSGTELGGDGFSVVQETEEFDLSSLGSGTYYASWTSCCRVSGINNVGTGSWSLETKIVWDGSTASASPSILPATIDVVAQGLNYAQNLDSVDPDGAPLSYQFITNSAAPDFGPTSQIPGISLDTSGTVAISGANSNAAAQGRWTYKTRITDGDGAYSERDVLLVFEDPGNTTAPNPNAPILSPIGSQTVAVGQSLSFPVSATDADGDSITVRSQQLPTGASFAEATSSGSASSNFSWTPASGQEGTYVVNFEVFDNVSVPIIDSEQVTITVTGSNTPPVLAAIGDKTVANSGTISFPVTATDVDGDNVTISGFFLPAGSTLTSTGPGAALFQWTPSGSQSDNTFTPITFRATDDGSPNLIHEETIAITVGAGNVAPQINAPASLTAFAGHPIQFPVVATDSPGQNVTLESTLKPTSAIFASTTGSSPITEQFVWTPTAADEGLNNVRFRAEDNGSPILSTLFDVTIDVVVAGPFVFDAAHGHNLRLSVVGSNLELYNIDEADVEVTRPLSSVTEVIINGAENDENDSLTIDFGNGAIGVPIAFNGGTDPSDDFDRLTITGASYDEAAFDYSGDISTEDEFEGSTLLKIGGANAETIQFTELESIEFSSTTNSVAVDLTDLAETVTLSPDASNAGHILVSPPLTGTTGVASSGHGHGAASGTAELLTFLAPAGSNALVTLNGLGGADELQVFDIQQLQDANAFDVVVDGGLDSDTYRLRSATLAGIQTLGNAILDSGEKLYALLPTLGNDIAILDAKVAGDAASEIHIDGDAKYGDGSSTGFIHSGLTHVHGGKTLTLNASSTPALGVSTNIEGTLATTGGAASVALGTGDKLFGDGFVQTNVDLLDGRIEGNLTIGGMIGASTATSAFIAPGNSPGVINAGDLSLASGTTLVFEIDGTAGAGAVGGHDLTNVAASFGGAGTVVLNDAVLQLTTVAANLPKHSSYLIIDNDGSDPVNGTFSGLGEGDTVPLGGLDLVITYQGGDGNDIVLFDPALLEFDDATSSEFEGTDPASAEGPTLIVAGDLRDLSDAQRTVTFSLTNLESTSEDVNSGSLSYVIPADNYAGGTDPASRFNLIEQGIVIIQNDNLLEGNENFDFDLNTYGSLISGQADPTDSLNPGTIHDILDDESATISVTATMVDETSAAQPIDVTLTITGTKDASFTDDFTVAPEVDLDANVVQGSIAGTATTPDDFAFSTQPISFAAGTVTGTAAATVTVDITPETDILVEGNEVTHLSVADLTDGRNTGSGDTNDLDGSVNAIENTVITIKDANSSSWSIQQSIGTTTSTGATSGIAEYDEGESASYTITYHTITSLAAGQTATVTVGFSSSDATEANDLDATVADAIEAAVVSLHGSNTPSVNGTFHFDTGTAVLTFTGDDVSVSPTLSFDLTAVEDALNSEGDETYTIALSAVGGTALPNVVLDPNGDSTAEGVDGSSVTTIIDDNDAPVAIDVDLGTIDEETTLAGVIDNDPSDGLFLGTGGGQTAGTFASDPDDELSLADTTIVSVEYSLDGGLTFTPFADLNAAGVDFDTATGDITFDPTSIPEYQALAAGEAALVEIVFNVTDSQSATSNDATISFTVDGVNDDPIILTEELAGSVTEDGDIADVTTGLITFSDVDLTDVHTATASFASTDHAGGIAFGALSSSVTVDTTGSGTGGEVDWSYAVDSAAIQFLADGETVTETHSITLDDDNGGMLTRDVVITITGTNDNPIILTEELTASVTEDGDIADITTGLITFSDVDLTDLHTAAAAFTTTDHAGGVAFGVLSSSVTTDTTGTGIGGEIDWSYAVDNAAIQFLADGETVTETHTITLDDDNGGVLTRDVAITITGTNDDPIILTEELAASVTEDGDVADVTSGLITFSDVDLTDVHTAAAAFATTDHAGGIAFGVLSSSVTTDTTGSGTGGAVDWSYTVDNAAIQFLADGETVTETHTITLDDDNGGVLTRDIVITITGTNDDPIIDSEELAGSVTEDGDVADVISGLITFSDVDLTDVHTTTEAFTSTDHVGGVAFGVLSSIVTTDTTGSGIGGEIDWSYAVDNAAIQFLADGETVTETHTITLDDDNGGVLTRDVVITITGTNDDPIIDSEELVASVTEDGDVADVTTGLITFSDVDLTDTHTATAAFSTTDHIDGIAFGVLSSSVTTDTTGLGTGGEVDWNYTVDNAAIQFLANGETVTETHTITLDDDNGGVLTRDVVITITGTNDDPTVVAEDLAGAVTEDDSTPDLIDSGTVDYEDIDLIDTHSVSVTFLSSTHTSQLGSLSANITIDANADVQVTWDYSVANDDVQFLPTAAEIEETYEVLLDDGNGGEVARQVIVTITGTNDTPVALPDFKTMLENTSVTAAVIANDTDVDSDDSPSNFSVDSVSILSTVGLDPSSSAPVGFATTLGPQLVFFDTSTLYDALDVGDTATTLIEYTMSDNEGASATSTLEVVITGVNDAPVAVIDTAGTMENTAITVDVLANDTDVDADDDASNFTLLSATILSTSGLNTSPAAAGNASVSSNQVDFDPGTAFDELDAGDLATVTISYVMTDQHGAPAAGTLVLTITGENDDPTVVDVALGATEDGGPEIGAFAGDDLDDEDDVTTLTYAITSSPSEGSVTNNEDGTFEFDPGTDFQDLAVGETRDVTFTYTATDSEGALSNTGNVVVTVTGVNDAPVSQDVEIDADEDGAVVSGAFDADDIDSDDDSASLTYAITSLPSEGSVTDNGDGTFAFDPGTDFQDLADGEERQVTFEYEATDSNTAASNTAEVTVTVTGVNDAPTASDVTGDADEDGVPVVVSFGGDDIDSNDDATTLTYAILSGPSEGSISNNGDGTFTFDPGTDFQDLAVGETRDVTITYDATDIHLETSNVANITITVTGVNDAPEAADVLVNADEDGASVTDSFVGTDVDSDDDGSSLTFAITSPPSEGSATDNGDGTFTFDPGTDFQDLADGEERVVTFEYEATDSNTAVSDTAIVTVTVTGTNDAPIAMDVNTAADEDGSIVTASFDADDIDSDDNSSSLTYAITSSPSEGIASNNGDGTFDFDPSSDFQDLADGETREVTFTYEATDTHSQVSNTADVTVTVTGTNDAPTTIILSNDSTPENVPANTTIATLTTDDVDLADVPTFSLVAGIGDNDNASFTIVGDQLALVPSPDFEVQPTYSIRIEAMDPLGETVQQTFTINVTDVLDTPQQFIVNTTNDTPDTNPGDGIAIDANGFTSLRAAIEEANALANNAFGDDLILFDIPSANHKVTVSTPLPTITESVIIDATSEPDFTGAPIVEITDGASIANGLALSGSGSTVMGLSITGFGDGIELAGASHSISGNYLGLDPDGNIVGNTYGANVQDSANNTFDGNLISGNSGSGVLVAGALSTGNVFTNNFIGTNEAGDAARGNGGIGLFLLSPDNVVGLPGQGNVISGNTGTGVGAVGAASNTIIQGNKIGTDPTGTFAVANGNYGIIVQTSGNTIGGSNADGSGNLISGNTRHGIGMTSVNATGNTIAGNMIGTDMTGTSAVANGSYGIYILNGNSNVIGGSDPSQSNLISGNGRSGLALLNSSSDNEVIGNRIGTTLDGMSTLANSGSGVIIANSSSSNDITGNQISGNTSSALIISGSGSSGNVATANLIGTNADQTAALNNGAYGIYISSANNVIGGPETDGNVIAGSTRGIVLDTANATGNVITGNSIGTDSSGTTDLGMSTGIQISNAAGDNVIGPDNIVANNSTGFRLIGNAGNGNTVTQTTFVNNSVIGIDIGSVGPTANDANDADEGTNRSMNHPVITNAEIIGVDLEITFSVPTPPTTAATYDLTVEFFKSDLSGQGIEFLSSQTYSTADFAAGDVTITIPSGDLVSGDLLTATATDADGNTSEFAGASMIAGIEESLQANMSGSRSSLDVNADGSITSLDALTVINGLNQSNAAGEAIPGLDELEDVNRDGRVSALDALQIINWLGVKHSGSSEDVSIDIDALIDGTNSLEAERVDALFDFIEDEESQLF